MKRSGKQGKGREPASVIIVDDHPVFAEGLRLLIRQGSGIDVVGTAGDADGALELVGRLRPRLVIVDISLKRGVSGIELIRILRERHPGLFVLVLTMHEERHVVERAFRAGADGYMLKEETAEAIGAAMRTVLAGKRYLSPCLAAELFVSTGEAGDGETDLSDRELEVLNLIGQGLDTKDIARKLFISAKTVETYRLRLRVKLGIGNTTELVRFAIRRHMK